MLQHHRTVVLCGKPTSCLNKQAHTGFSGHIMEAFLFYTKIIPHLTHQWSHLSSTASELKRNCVIKECEKNTQGVLQILYFCYIWYITNPINMLIPGASFVILYTSACWKYFCITLHSTVFILYWQFWCRNEKYWHVSRRCGWNWGNT